MVRKLIIAAALLLGGLAAYAQVDSVAIEKALDLLSEYVVTLEPESPEKKSQEVDYIIETCTDSTLRQAVAQMLYDHYITSNVMGDEEVAIHMYDRWFSTHEIEMGWDGALLNALLTKLFV